MLPPNSNRRRRGDRTASQIVVAALFTGGITTLRRRGTREDEPHRKHRDDDDDQHHRDDAVDGDVTGVDRGRGEREAMTNRITCAAMLPTSASNPPAATADAMSMPWSCRNRTCEARPPTAGTARFETTSRAGAPRCEQRQGDRHAPHERERGREVGEERHRERDGQPPPVGAGIVFQNSSGSPIWLNSAKTAISVPTAISRFVVLTR